MLHMATRGHQRPGLEEAAARKAASTAQPLFPTGILQGLGSLCVGLRSIPAVHNLGSRRVGTVRFEHCRASKTRCRDSRAAMEACVLALPSQLGLTGEAYFLCQPPFMYVT